MTDAAAPGNRPRSRLRYAVEAAGVYLLAALCRALPVGAASAIGGALARTIGPRLALTRRAARHYARAFPDATGAQITTAMRAMWDNLGRTVFEYPNLVKIDCYNGTRVTVHGAEHLDALRDDGRAGIFFSGHLANWEIMPLSVAQRGCDISLVYRAANNPHVDRMILRARGAITNAHVPKGAPGARQMLKIIKAGGHLGMLVDQKLNAGINVPFFGHPAMTAPAIAQLALKYDLPVVPCAVRRTHGAHFVVTYAPPLEHPTSGDHEKDVYDLMVAINTFLEDAIRANPPHWMWLHRRWVD
ncbi:MAG: lauroyl acyltransferase [Alphaproteobacteria bacterium]|nr:lauroyl acyltransferase [Alphaproteobacteria bacterium]